MYRTMQYSNDRPYVTSPAELRIVRSAGSTEFVNDETQNMAPLKSLFRAIRMSMWHARCQSPDQRLCAYYKIIISIMWSRIILWPRSGVYCPYLLAECTEVRLEWYDFRSLWC